MTKLAPEWVRTSDPVIRSPARYRWTTAPAMQPTLGCGSLSNRDRHREQLVLCRSHLCNRYLLAGEDPPLCISCQENLTVEHILIQCAEYFHVRYQCFYVNNLGELFLTVSPNIIIHFIRRAGLLYLI